MKNSHYRESLLIRSNYLTLISLFCEFLIPISYLEGLMVHYGFCESLQKIISYS